MLSPESVKAKLENIQQTQESVETVSLWCLHHKDNATVIVSVWQSLFKAASVKLRLSLLYLANDVCQKARRKRNKEFAENFKPVLREAFILSRTQNIQSNLDRLLKIWEERSIFDGQFISDLKASLKSSSDASVSFPVGITNLESRPSTDESDKLISEFKLNNLLNELERHEKSLESMERIRTLLPSTSFTFDSNVKALLKDRREGLKFIEETNQSQKRLQEFIEEFDGRIKRHHHLMSTLEQARLFYETQLNEATIVQMAYMKFGTGVKAVLEELKSTRNSDLFSALTPPADAPSPAPFDDPFADGVEAAFAATKRDSDKLEAVDMDLDDEVKDNANVSSRLIVPQSTSLEGMGITLATNQSFFNNPPMSIPSNGENMDEMHMQKKRKLDPRQQRHVTGTAADNMLGTQVVAPSVDLNGGSWNSPAKRPPQNAATGVPGSSLLGNYSMAPPGARAQQHSFPDQRPRLGYSPMPMSMFPQQQFASPRGADPSQPQSPPICFENFDAVSSPPVGSQRKTLMPNFIGQPPKPEYAVFDYDHGASSAVDSADHMTAGNKRRSNVSNLTVLATPHDHDRPPFTLMSSRSDAQHFNPRSPDPSPLRFTTRGGFHPRR